MSQTNPVHSTKMSQIGLVADIVIAALTEHGIYEKMTLEQRNIYIPQFIQSAEERVGLELFGDLHEADQQAYIVLISNADTTPIQIAEFWHMHHPSFETRLVSILQTFVRELLDAFVTTV